MRFFFIFSFQTKRKEKNNVLSPFPLNKHTVNVYINKESGGIIDP